MESEAMFDELYQEIILDHNRNPRNAANLDHIPENRAHENPTCGDSVKIEVSISPEGMVEGIRFSCKGCAISTASASMMSELLEGISVEEAAQRAGDFVRIMRAETGPETLDEWGDLSALRGVIQYPLRVKCATLAWHALLDAIEQQKGLDEVERGIESKTLER
jgi:nitrogen fixation NifU-like protein